HRHVAIGGRQRKREPGTDADGSDRAEARDARHRHTTPRLANRSWHRVGDEDAAVDQRTFSLAERLDHALPSTRRWRIELPDVQDVHDHPRAEAARAVRS